MSPNNSNRQNEIREAFEKLKQNTYYDKSNTNLPLRKRVAEFEIKAETDKQERFNNIEQLINEANESISNDTFKKLLNQINYNLIPKDIQLKQDSDFNSTTFKETFITNDRVGEEYVIDRFNILIDCPVEIHILSVLWLMKVGVKLDKDLPDNCFGNRLIINNNDEIVKGRGCFKPYQRQYQAWRDNGVKKAKTYLENGNDVAILNIDITEFYYHIKLNWDENLFDSNDLNGEYKTLNELMKEIHRTYSNRLFKEFQGKYNFNDRNNSKEELLLPLGLMSSFVIANHYLKEWDEFVDKEVRPVYYGRYVDDILIVITRHKGLQESQKEFDDDWFPLTSIQEKISSKKILKSLKFLQVNMGKTLILNFNKNGYQNTIKDIDNVMSKKHYSLINKFLYFRLAKKEELFIKPEKTMLYEFKADQSHAVIEKLKKDLEERSSEFRFLPEDDEMTFDESSFELNYDDTFGKPITLRDYKESRYGLSSFLSKKIFVSIRTSEDNAKEDIDKVLSFFKGSNAIRFYQQWERIFTFLIVNNRKKDIVTFFNNTWEEIEKIQCKKRRLKIDILFILFLSLTQAASLNPYLFKKGGYIFIKIMKALKPLGFASSFHSTINTFRLSKFVRHTYIAQPMLNYTKFGLGKLIGDFPKENLKEGLEEYEDLANPRLDFNKIGSLMEIVHDGKNDRDISSPRRVKFFEVCLAKLNMILSTLSNDKVNNNDIQEVIEIINSHRFLDESYDIYKRINTPDIVEEKDEIFKAYAEQMNEGVEIQIDLLNKSFKKDFRVALANMEIDFKKYAEKAISGKSVLTHKRHRRFTNIFNRFEKENVKEEEKSGSHLLVLPEMSVPFDWLFYFAGFAVPRRKALTFGVEHVKTGKVCFNIVMNVLPVSISPVKGGGVIKDAIPIPRIKNHYSYEEKKIINQNRLIPGEPSRKNQKYFLIHWCDLYFTTFYCFELCDIDHRSKFRSKVDFIISPEYNKDVNYFSSIVDSASRDLSVYIIQVNSSDFGDSRITQPAKTEIKDLVKVKGGQNDVIIVQKLNIQALRNHLNKNHLFGNNGPFKPTPPNYEIENLEKRINNKPIL